MVSPRTCVHTPTCTHKLNLSLSSNASCAVCCSHADLLLRHRASGPLDLPCIPFVWNPPFSLRSLLNCYLSEGLFKIAPQPWLVWLGQLGVTQCPGRWPVTFLVWAHAPIVGSIPSRGHGGGANGCFIHTSLFLSLPPPFLSLLKKKILINKIAPHPIFLNFSLRFSS